MECKRLVRQLGVTFRNQKKPYAPLGLPDRVVYVSKQREHLSTYFQVPHEVLEILWKKAGCAIVSKCYSSFCEASVLTEYLFISWKGQIIPTSGYEKTCRCL